MLGPAIAMRNVNVMKTKKLLNYSELSLKTCSLFPSLINVSLPVLSMLLNAKRLTNKASCLQQSGLITRGIKAGFFNIPLSMQPSFKLNFKVNLSRLATKQTQRPLQILVMYRLSGMRCTHYVPAGFIRGPFFCVIINSCAVLIDGHYLCTSHHLFVVQRWTHKSNPAISTTVQI